MGKAPPPPNGWLVERGARPVPPPFNSANPGLAYISKAAIYERCFIMHLSLAPNYMYETHKNILCIYYMDQLKIECKQQVKLI